MIYCIVQFLTRYLNNNAIWELSIKIPTSESAIFPISTFGTHSRQWHGKQVEYVPYLRNYLELFYTNLITDVFTFVDILIRFWDQKVWSQQAMTRETGWMLYLRKYFSKFHQNYFKYVLGHWTWLGTYWLGQKVKRQDHLKILWKPYITTQWREFHPILITNVFVLVDELISFWDHRSKVKVTAAVTRKTVWIQYIRKYFQQNWVMCVPGPETYWLGQKVKVTKGEGITVDGSPSSSIYFFGSFSSVYILCLLLVWWMTNIIREPNKWFGLDSWPAELYFYYF